MKPKVAVSTLNGKAYFIIVNELKRRNIPFLSLSPGELVPAEIRVVVTTQIEKQKTIHCKILVYDLNMDPEILGSEIVKVLLGKEDYANVIIGVDPGEAFGLAVIADDSVIDTENCFSAEETLSVIKRTLRTVDLSTTTVTVKIGSGVPVFHSLLEALDEKLPLQVSLQIVSEAGTNRYSPEVKNRRGFRHMVSATLIARRPGVLYSRKKPLEQDS
jgi:hypothetical protein